MASKAILDGATPFGIAMALYIFSTGFDFLSIASGVSVTRVTGFMLLIFSFFKGKTFDFHIDSLAKALFLLLMFGDISFLLSSNPSAGTNWYFSLVINILIVYVALGFTYTRKDVKICQTALIASALVLCVLMFTSSGSIGTSGLSDRVVVDLWGSQQDANEFNGYLLFAFSWFIYCGLSRKSIVSLVLSGLVLYVVLMTGSRGGLMALGVTGCLSAVFALKNSRHRLLFSFIVIAAVLIFAALFDNFLSLLPSSVAERYTEVSLTSGTASYRMHAWTNVIDAFLASDPLHMLLGHGFGSTPQVTYFHDVCHNAYLELLYSVGVLGLLAYVSCAVLCGRAAYRNGDEPLVASIFGFMILIFSLSAPAMKALWAVLTICGMFVSITRRESCK